MQGPLTVLELSQPRRSQVDWGHACGTGLPAQTNKSNLWSSFQASLSCFGGKSPPLVCVVPSPIFFCHHLVPSLFF